MITTEDGYIPKCLLNLVFFSNEKPKLIYILHKRREKNTKIAQKLRFFP